MNFTKANQRNSTLDIIRIFAVFCVISDHFLVNNRLYSETITGFNMYIMCVMRTFFSICVPLFIILTGYLVCNKELSKKYYLGIKKILITYVLASIACILFKHFYLHSVKYSIKTAFFAILDFSGANYSWYIEMYIGLFLLIPFLNLIYHGLRSKQEKLILLATLFFLTVAPSIFNIFDFQTSGWWSNPAISDSFQNLIPDWWKFIYPITYYFIGCYLREYKINIKTSILVTLLPLITVLFGSFNYYRSYNSTFKNLSFIHWGGFEPFILTILIFVLLTRIKSDNFPVSIKYILWKISDLVLCVYLVSYIMDSYTYPKLIKAIPSIDDRLKYYIIIVPFIFVGSLLISICIKMLEKVISLILSKIYSFIKSKAQI